MVSRPGRLTVDARRIVAAQAARALAYGLGSVLIGVTLARQHRSGLVTGAVLTCILAGNAVGSVLVARYADRFGRRRAYRLLFVGMAVAGTVFALSGSLTALLVAALSGTVSTDVIESGPFTSLEQGMLPSVSGEGSTHVFAIYNMIATIAGSCGALLALATSSARALLVYPAAAVIGLVAAAGISPTVESASLRPGGRPLERSRGIVLQLSALFAVDSFGGGFVPGTFIAYLFTRKYSASPHTLALVFFAIGLLQAMSFRVAVRIAQRIGLLRTMVFTHLPSNVLLAAVAFAPNLASAIVLLLARSALSQMDVPTRQSFVAAVVDPSERTAAAGYTNTARYVTRPIASLLAGITIRAGLGVPFVIAGALKSVYDASFYTLYRKAPVLR